MLELQTRFQHWKGIQSKHPITDWHRQWAFHCLALLLILLIQKFCPDLLTKFYIKHCFLNKIVLHKAYCCVFLASVDLLTSEQYEAIIPNLQKKKILGVSNTRKLKIQVTIVFSTAITVINRPMGCEWCQLLLLNKQIKISIVRGIIFHKYP